MPAKGDALKSETPNWGIELVPERLRVLGLFDTGLLWSSLGLSLLVLVAGTFLVPYLSLPAALAAILVGGLVGNAMLGFAGLIGADAGVPAMVLMRAPLGRRGSYLATALNILQNVGWTIFELIVIATAASALSEQLFGFRGEWLWKIVAAGATTALALLGPVDFVRRWVRRFAIWVVLASLAYLTWWALHDAGLHSLWSRPGTGGLSFWQGVDLMIAMPASWLPLAADYTRFSRNRGGAFWGTGLGYLLPNMWLFALGAVLLLSRNLSDAASLMTAIAAGGLASGLALLALGVDETKEPFANVYSTAVSLQNLVPRVSQRLLIVIAAAVSTAGAFAIDLTRYPTFLYLLGSFFVPLFGVLAADWLIRRGYDRDAVFAAPVLRSAQLGAWLAGFALYQWLLPTGPAWWTDLIARLHPQSFGVGASLPAFALSFLLSALVNALARRPASASSTV
jgi:NCS1 family nucleobase:cation symporter-1